MTAVGDTFADVPGAEPAISLRTLRALMDAVCEGIVVVDKAGSVLLYNELAGVTLGLEGAGDTPPKPTTSFYRGDRVTPLHPSELPITRARRGHTTSDMEIFVRSSSAPAGAVLRCSARPILALDGTVIGAVGTFDDITEQRAAEERLALMATTDELTGLPNYRALQQRLADLWAEGERGRAFALVFVDVDHFKSFNDRFGHAIGNDVLVRIANTLRKQVRGTDMVARFGGEEFCVLFVDVDERLAATLAERLRTAVERVEFPERLTVSIGVCEFSDHFADTGSLVRAADEAMYRAKENGRNCVVRFQELRQKQR